MAILQRYNGFTLKFPIDVEVWVIPRQCPFALRMVIVRRFVEHVRIVGEHMKAVCKSWRNPKHLEVLFRKSLGVPFAKSCRTPTQINRNVENLAYYRPNQFSLWMAYLIMQAAHNVSH